MVTFSMTTIIEVTTTHHLIDPENGSADRVDPESLRRLIIFMWVMAASLLLLCASRTFRYAYLAHPCPFRARRHPPLRPLERTAIEPAAAPPPPPPPPQQPLPPPPAPPMPPPTPYLGNGDLPVIQYTSSEEGQFQPLKRSMTPNSFYQTSVHHLMQRTPSPTSQASLHFTPHGSPHFSVLITSSSLHTPPSSTPPPYHQEDGLSSPESSKET